MPQLSLALLFTSLAAALLGFGGAADGDLGARGVSAARVMTFVLPAASAAVFALSRRRHPGVLRKSASGWRRVQR